MLKRFFISMLGTMAGLWISLAIVFFCGLMLVGMIAGSSDKSGLKKHSVLYFDLSGEIAERYQPSSFFEIIREADNEAPSLDEMINSLRKAADDSRIDALFLNCNSSSMGMASRQELIEAINDFKINSGKPVYAYADNYTQGDYLLATTADSIFLNPIGSIDIHGVGGMTPFFREALDKLGISMQIIKVGTFKSAVEPFILTSMSEPARLQMQQYCDSLWGFAAGTIAESRAIENDSIRAWASDIIFTRQSQDFIELGLADRLAYRRHVDNLLREITETENSEDIRLVTPSEYLAAPSAVMIPETRPHIAVLYAVGDIVDSGDEGISGTKMVPEIIKLADDDNVRGLILRVNSGGGSAFASEQIWEALEYFKSKDKPFYVSMGDYAASGGYYISCGADRIYADATTITGSIGVFGMIPDLSGLVSGKLGVNFSTVETNENAASINIMQAMTPEQYAAMQRHVDNTYALFTERVSAGRDLPVDSVRTIAEGRVWVGNRAIELGLVDELGTLSDAISAITAETDLDATATVAYPIQEEEMWMRILRESGTSSDIKAAAGLADLDAETLEYLRLVQQLRTMNPIQARMEKIVIN